MMRSTLATAAALMLFASTLAAAQSADDVFGIWRHPENGSHVEMYRCGDALCARIVRVEDGQKTDDKNPDPMKRNRSILGLAIMSGASPSGPASWKGELYNRADGKTYSGTATVKTKDSLELSGCSMIVWCKTVTWTRVK
ncbi:MAG: DUF2147 domain-containing protein [Pseudomonadota bacterium]